MIEKITIISDEGKLSIDMSGFYNDKKLDKIVKGLLESDEKIELHF